MRVCVQYLCHVCACVYLCLCVCLYVCILLLPYPLKTIYVFGVVKLHRERERERGREREGEREGGREGGRDVFFVSPPHYDSRIQSRVTHARRKCLACSRKFWGKTSFTCQPSERASRGPTTSSRSPCSIAEAVVMASYEGCHRHCPPSLNGGSMEGGRRRR